MAGFFSRFFGASGPDKAKMQAATAAQNRFNAAKGGIDTILGQRGGSPAFTDVRQAVTDKILADNARRNGTAPQKAHPYEGRGFNDISNLPVSTLHPHKDDLIEDLSAMRAAARGVTVDGLAAGHEAAKLEFEAYLGEEKGADAFAKYQAFIGRSDAAKSLRYFEMEREYAFVMNNTSLALRKGNREGERSMVDAAEEKINGYAAANAADLAATLELDGADKKLAPLLAKYADPVRVQELAAYDPRKPETLENKAEFARQHGQMIDAALRELPTASPDDDRRLYDVVKARMGEAFDPDRTPDRAPARDAASGRDR